MWEIFRVGMVFSFLKYYGTHNCMVPLGAHRSWKLYKSKKKDMFTSVADLPKGILMNCIWSFG